MRRLSDRSLLRSLSPMDNIDFSSPSSWRRSGLRLISCSSRSAAIRRLRLPPVLPTPAPRWQSDGACLGGRPYRNRHGVVPGVLPRRPRSGRAWLYRDLWGEARSCGNADFGNQVVCVDKDAAKIDQLAQGKCPIFEPFLDALIARNTEAGRLSFATESGPAVQFRRCRVHRRRHAVAAG